jgi:hypothetical protein
MINPSYSETTDWVKYEVFQRTCTVTGHLYVVKIPSELYWKWRDGELIQKAIPQLKPEQREFLVTGMTPAEQRKLFKKGKGK